MSGSIYRDVNSPNCWKDYDIQLEKERKQLQKIQSQNITDQSNISKNHVK